MKHYVLGSSTHSQTTMRTFSSSSGSSFSVIEEVTETDNPVPEVAGGPLDHLVAYSPNDADTIAEVVASRGLPTESGLELLGQMSSRAIRISKDKGETSEDDTGSDGEDSIDTDEDSIETEDSSDTESEMEELSNAVSELCENIGRLQAETSRLRRERNHASEDAAALRKGLTAAMVVVALCLCLLLSLIVKNPEGERNKLTRENARLAAYVAALQKNLEFRAGERMALKRSLAAKDEEVQSLTFRADLFEAQSRVYSEQVCNLVSGLEDVDLMVRELEKENAELKAGEKMELKRSLATRDKEVQSLTFRADLFEAQSRVYTEQVRNLVGGLEDIDLMVHELEKENAELKEIIEYGNDMDGFDNCNFEMDDLKAKNDHLQDKVKNASAKLLRLRTLSDTLSTKNRELKTRVDNQHHDLREANALKAEKARLEQTIVGLRRKNRTLILNWYIAVLGAFLLCCAVLHNAKRKKTNALA